MYSGVVLHKSLHHERHEAQRISWTDPAKCDFCLVKKQLNWLIDWCIFILVSRESDGALCLGRIRTRLVVDHFPSFPVDVFDFFPLKFAACSKSPSRDNYRKASFPRTQQRDQGVGWTQDPAIRVVVKTTPLPIWPHCRLTQLMLFLKNFASF